MLWTRDAEVALNNTKVDKRIMQDTAKKFLDILNALINKTTEDLSKLDRVKVETLITIHVHQNDIFDELVCIHTCPMKTYLDRFHRLFYLSR
jgi:dynein heavy chain, axonemal